MIKSNKDYVDEPVSFANTPPLQLTLRELQSIFTSSRFWIGLVCIIALLTLIGPFGTDDSLNIPTRIVYWAFTALTTFAIGMTMSLYFGAVLFQAGLNEFISRLAGGSVAGIGVGVFVWIANQNIFGMDLAGDYKFSIFMAITIAIALVVSTLFFLLTDQRQSASSADDKRCMTFFTRLPVHLGKKLISLEAQDHYVKVTTKNGSELILLRLADATNELQSYDGLRVHRSWWVARDAIKSSHRKDGKMELRMTNDNIVPVARSYQKSLREADIA